MFKENCLLTITCIAGNINEGLDLHAANIDETNMFEARADDERE